MMKSLIMLLGFLIVSTGCKDEEVLPQVEINAEKRAHLISQSEDTIEIDGRLYSMFAYLQRDFMPGIPPSGPPLASISHLIALDSLPIPNALDFDTQYVINGDTIWTAEMKDRGVETEDYKLSRGNLSGPRWQTGIFVTVIILVKNKVTGQVWYLKSDEVKIIRTA